MNETTSLPERKNSAKFAFFYMLSLVALITTAISVGTIIFQIINKLIADPAGIYGARYSSSAIRFAISSMIIAAPIYFLMMWQILKNLSSGIMDKDSGIRRWLTYFILFISAVVMLGWLIGTLNSFLNGEITSKFILKALTSIIISGIIFSFYFYDMKRAEVSGKKDKVIMAYYIGSLVIIISTLVSGFFYIESPQKVRDLRHDSTVVGQLDQIEVAINDYYNRKNTVPGSLEELLADSARSAYIVSDTIKDPETQKQFEYKKNKADTYEICAEFKLTTAEFNESENYDKFLTERWKHENGRQCFTKKAEKTTTKTIEELEKVPAIQP